MNDTKRETYTVRCVREEGWWIVTVDELDGVFTNARRLDQVEDLARDAIALWLDADPESFDLVLEVDIYGDAGDARQEALDARAAADEARTRAALATTTAVEELVGAGLPMRDVGALLDISHQRVAQIMGEKPTTRARKPAAAGRVIKNTTSAKAGVAAAHAAAGGRSGRYVSKAAAKKRTARKS